MLSRELYFPLELVYVSLEYLKNTDFSEYGTMRHVIMIKNIANAPYSHDNKI